MEGFWGTSGVARSITSGLPPPRGVYYFSCQRKSGEMITELQLARTLFRVRTGSGLALEERRGKRQNPDWEQYGIKPRNWMQRRWRRCVRAVRSRRSGVVCDLIATPAHRKERDERGTCASAILKCPPMKLCILPLVCPVARNFTILPARQSGAL